MGENVRVGSGSAREYSRPAGGDRRHGRLRLVYFWLAATWGYATGVGIVLAALHASGIRVPWGAAVVGMTLCGVVIALLGGGLAAGAYREAKRRAR